MKKKLFFVCTSMFKEVYKLKFRVMINLEIIEMNLCCEFITVNEQ